MRFVGCEFCHAEMRASVDSVKILGCLLGSAQDEDIDLIFAVVFGILRL